MATRPLWRSCCIPTRSPAIERDVLMRYQPQWVSQAGLEGQQEEWTFRMINTKRPLEEKITLLWHQIFGHRPRQVRVPEAAAD